MRLIFFYLFIVIFAAGLITGYFVERTGIIYTQTEIENLRNDIENIQIQEMFISSEGVDCNLMFSTMGKLSYDLYNLVNNLRNVNPTSDEFDEMKIQADFLSLRAWILSRNIRQKCTEEILPILFLYSNNCDKCQEQDQILQELKEGHESVMVYSVDIENDQAAVRLVKDAYRIESTPSIILNHRLYGEMSRQELENEICEFITCS